MQRNAEVGLFTKPSQLAEIIIRLEFLDDNSNKIWTIFALDMKIVGKENRGWFYLGLKNSGNVWGLLRGDKEISGARFTIIYRGLQESLNKVVKQNEANLMRLYRKKTNKRIEMTIGDNSLGFDLDEVLSVESFMRGIGLASMKEMTEVSGGSVDIQSVKGTGSTIRASWPDKGI